MGQTDMRRWTQIVALGVALAAGSSCGDVVRSGRAPVSLVVNSLSGLRGGPSVGQPSGFLISDVITNVTSPAPCSQASPCPTVFDDTGDAVLGIVLKDPGTGATPAAPSQANAVTITRIHVKFIRADGRNTQGVDVPYEFDTAATGTVTDQGGTDFKFELVRHTAKGEPPLLSLASSGVIISTIAQVTFYGVDQVGNAVSVMGQIGVNFGNFGDTQ